MPPGTDAPEGRAYETAECGGECPAGYMCDHKLQPGAQVPCPAGFYCPAGSGGYFSDYPFVKIPNDGYPYAKICKNLKKDGTWCDALDWALNRCVEIYYCPEGGSSLELCPEGKECPYPGSPLQECPAAWVCVRVRGARPLFPPAPTCFHTRRQRGSTRAGVPPQHRTAILRWAVIA